MRTTRFLRSGAALGALAFSALALDARAVLAGSRGTAEASVDGSASFAALSQEVAKIKKELAALVPSEPYIVIDTKKNMIYYRRGGETLHEALCSTGCDSTLTAPDGRVWRFATPTGTFRVKRKINNPTWVKPDWAFIEEGKPIPKGNHPDRFDDTAMGSFALDFGDGYYIHGTLYRRLLGENITHGCVRVADEDLEPIFDKAKVGTLVYIF
jgi:L,D-transpeptidase YbiS